MHIFKRTVPRPHNPAPWMRQRLQPIRTPLRRLTRYVDDSPQMTPRAVSAQLPHNPTPAPTYIASQASLLLHGPSAAPAPSTPPESDRHHHGTSPGASTTPPKNSYMQTVAPKEISSAKVLKSARSKAMLHKPTKSTPGGPQSQNRISNLAQTRTSQQPRLSLQP